MVCFFLWLILYIFCSLQESKINVGVRSIFCVLEKAEEKWWKKLLKGDDKVPHYVKVDWDKWADEDDDAGILLASLLFISSNSSA